MKQGDVAKIDVVAKNSSGEVFDTTIEEEARKAGIYSKEIVYRPMLVAVGKGMVLTGLDEVLLEMEEGQEKTAEIKREKAFGERREELVKLVSIENFRKQDLNPFPGMPVEIDTEAGRMVGRVQSVSGGRVRVDFNHRLAGQDLNYWVKVVKKFSSTEEKVVACAEEYLDKKAKASFKDGVAEVHAPQEITKDTVYLVAKNRFNDFLLNYVPEVKKIVFREEFVRENV